MLSLEGDCGKVCPTAVDPDQQRQRHTQPNGMPPTGSPAGAPTVRPGPFRRHARRMTPAMRALRPRVGPLLAIAVLCAAVPVAYAISGLPAGLASQLVSSETTVVDVCTIDSVRGFVVKKSGTLLFWNGTGLSTSLDLLANSLEPLLDSGESGFLSCLATSNTVFTFYTTTKQFALLTKWTFDSATGITNPASEVRLLTFPGVSRTNHNGGAMAWDGTAIVISRGDVASCDAGDSAGCALVQSLDSQWGKILRVDQAGNGLPDNPYWDGNASSVRSTVWAVGQRNPWTMTFDPNNPSDLFIFDVGTRDKECVKRLTKGGQGNYPCLEGTKDMGKCSSMLTPANASVVVYEYDHAGGASIIGGAFMSPSQYGPQFANAVLFGDCSKGILKLAAPGFSSVGPAGSESCPTRIKVAPNGRVWILTLFDGIWEVTGPAFTTTMTSTTSVSTTSLTPITSTSATTLTSSTSLTSTSQTTQSMITPTTSTATQSATRTTTIARCVIPTSRGTVPPLVPPFRALSWASSSSNPAWTCRLDNSLPCIRNGRLVGNRRGAAQPIRIGGRRYSRGFGIRGRSTVSVDLGRRCGSLSVGFGLDDSTPTLVPQLVFFVVADGRTVFTSMPRNRNHGVRFITVSLVGVRNLRLVTRQTSPGVHNAAWVEPLLACGPNSLYLPTIELSHFGFNGRTAEPGTRVRFRASARDYLSRPIPSGVFAWQLSVGTCTRAGCSIAGGIARSSGAPNATFVLPRRLGCMWYLVEVEVGDGCGGRNRAVSSLLVPSREGVCSSL